MKGRKSAGRTGASLIVPLIVLLGLGVGFLRETVLAYVFGADQDVAVFRVAYALPSVVSETVAISLVSGLIPVFLLHKRREAVRASLWAVGLVAGSISLIGIVTMPWQATLFAPGFSGASRDSLIESGRICWSMSLMLLLSYPLRAAMSVENKVWASSLGTLLRNAYFILLFAVFAMTFNGVSSMTAAVAAALTGAAVLGTYLVLFARMGALRDRGSADLPSRAPIRPLILTILAIFGSQILLTGGRILDRMVGSTLNAQALASIEYSYAVVMALGAVIGSSANLVLAPEIGRAVEQTGRIPRKFWRITGLITLFSTGLGALCWLVATPMIRLIYQRGAFGAEETATTATVFAVQVLALGFLIGSLLLVQMLILVGDRSWLVAIAGVKLAIKGLVLWVALPQMRDLVAISLSFGVAEAASLLMLLVAVYYRQHRSGTRKARTPTYSNQ